MDTQELERIIRKCHKEYSGNNSGALELACLLSGEPIWKVSEVSAKLVVSGKL
jgi:hypothetical protein